MPKASPLKRVGGKLASAKSKTGNPACSKAMSDWVRNRKGGTVPEGTYSILAKCRAQSRQNKQATAKQAAGKLAAGRGTWQRTERAKELLAARAQKRTATSPKSSGFSLKQDSAAGRKATTFENRGPGRTGMMFDMKRGDLPGQTSIFDKVKAVGTGAAKAKPDLPEFGKRVHVAVASVPESKRVGGLVWVHHAHQEYQKKHGPIPLDDFKSQLAEANNKRHLDLGRADVVEAFKSGDVKASTIDHMGGRFNFIRVAPPTAPISGGDHVAASTAPMSMRERIAHQRLAKDLTGETRRRAADKLGKARTKLKEATRDPGAHTDHSPGATVNLKTDLIHFDPQRFQYKMAQTDLKTGAVGSLAGVKHFDPELAGTVQVWKDPDDGKVYVVNGHNRLDLARKLKAGRISARFLDAPNAEQARAKGAITNIAEGRGTAIDAAKFFRDTGHTRETLEGRGVPLREKIATDGLALTSLEKGLFNRVIDGSIPQERAVIIGGSGLPHEQQKALVDLVDKLPRNREVNNATLRELTDTVKAAGSKATTTKSLFGDEVDDQSLAIHRASLQATIKQRLGREKRLFGTVAKSKAAEDLARAGNQINTAESGKISQDAAIALGGFDLLKNLSGPVSKTLNQASERIHAGENPRKVTDETYRIILKQLPEMLAGRA